MTVCAVGRDHHLSLLSHFVVMSHLGTFLVGRPWGQVGRVQAVLGAQRAVQDGA